MSSPWQLPLPVGDYAQDRVVVYFYSNGWIPITYLCLSEAIVLHRKALLEGKEILAFPPGLDLDAQNIFLSESSGRLEFGQNELTTEKRFHPVFI